jgi:hypothetical protein
MPYLSGLDWLNIYNSDWMIKNAFVEARAYRSLSEAMKGFYKVYFIFGIDDKQKYDSAVNIGDAGPRTKISSFAPYKQLLQRIGISKNAGNITMQIGVATVVGSVSYEIHYHCDILPTTCERTDSVY